MKNQIMEFMINDSQERHIKTQSKRLTACLLDRMNVSANDYNLVYVIGSGNEKSNREALEHWILKRLASDPIPNVNPTELINILESELEHLFSSI